MEMNKEGHLSAQGKTTDPLKSGGWWLGNKLDYIGFDYMLLPNGEVALHSALSFSTDNKEEDFLYEVWPRDEAYASLKSMVEDACDYMAECGKTIAQVNIESMFEKMRQELTVGLH
jgi:hypothetical protein